MSDTPSVDLAGLPGPASRLGRQGVVVAFVLIPLVFAIGLGCLGLEQTDSPLSAVTSLAYVWFTSGSIAVAFLLAAIGFGGPVARVLARGGRDRLCLQPVAGLAALLFIDHLVGVAGGFSGGAGRFVAAGVLAVGVGMLAVQLLGTLKSKPRLPTAPWSVLFACVSVSVLLVAAANPPGVLWRSEAGGFDALSYHLPLAQEWASGDRVWPLKHNVYSFLPSYAEAGYTQVAALCGGNLILGDGVGVLACQLVHVGQALIAAFTVGALATSLARRCGVPAYGAWIGGGLAFAVVLSVPWTVVTGSLAYNEMPALALAAGAMLAAVSDGGAIQRGLGAGLLLGAAGACKLTFLFMAGPTVGLVLLTAVPPRQWIKPVIAGVLGGVVMLGPPLARNWAACGNPVFPLSTVMGRAHWTQEQADRFHKAHGREGTIGEQVDRLFSVSPGYDPVTRQPLTFDGEPRGVMHGQWAMMFPVGGGVLVLLALRRATRETALVLAAGIGAGFVFWVVSTHGQSRFLMPLLPNLACAVGVLGGWLIGEGGPLVPARRLSVIFVCVLPLLASAASARCFLTEQGGRPNRMLTAGTTWFSGEGIAPRLDSLTVAQRQELEENASPAVYIAITLKPGEKLMMLGDATPLYYTVPVIYNTVWDRSVLALAMEKSPSEPSAWLKAVQQTGATHLLINLGEIARYERTYGFDPAITKERLDLWLFRLGEPIRAWPVGQQPTLLLYEIPPEGGRKTEKPKGRV